MKNSMTEHKSEAHNSMGFIRGFLLGGLAGAVAMLLVAPQSGEKTRAKIVNKSTELRDQTVGTVEDAMTQARAKTHQITADVRDKAEKLQQRGQEMLAEQKDHLSDAVETGNAAVQDFLD